MIFTYIITKNVLQQYNKFFNDLLLFPPNQIMYVGYQQMVRPWVVCPKLQY